MKYLVPAAAIVVVIACLGVLHRNRTRDRVSALAPVEAAPGMDQLWELLFADQPLSDFLSGQPAGSWPEFREALEASREERKQDAIAALSKTLVVPNVETRTALMAWNTLRELGVSPPSEEADIVRGVVVEIPLKEDAVVLAVYSDGRARLFSRRGKALLWEPTPGDSEITSLLERVLADAQTLVSSAQPGRKRTVIPEGSNRVTLLTFGGTRTFETGKADPIAIDSSVGAAIRVLTAREPKSAQGGREIECRRNLEPERR